MNEPIAALLNPASGLFTANTLDREKKTFAEVDAVVILPHAHQLVEGPGNRYFTDGDSTFCTPESDKAIYTESRLGETRCPSWKAYLARKINRILSGQNIMPPMLFYGFVQLGPGVRRNLSARLRSSAAFRSPFLPTTVFASPDARRDARQKRRGCFSTSGSPAMNGPLRWSRSRFGNVNRRKPRT